MTPIDRLFSKPRPGRHSPYGTGFAALALLASLMLVPHRASATSIVQQEFARWKLQDKCIADSIAKYPDRTADAQSKRDAFVDDCLDKNVMPPRNHLAPADSETVPVLQSH